MLAHRGENANDLMSPCEYSSLLKGVTVLYRVCWRIVLINTLQPSAQQTFIIFIEA